MRAQNECVAELVAAGEDAHRLDDLYRRKLAALDALKQSLLHQAFHGDL